MLETRMLHSLREIPTGLDFLESRSTGFYKTKPYLAFGASGTGKSILGMQYAHAGLARGESVVYVCREKADDLVCQAERLGIDLTKYLDGGQLTLLEYDDGFREIVQRQGPAAVLDELQAQVGEQEIGRVVLDPVDPLFSSLDDEAQLRSELRHITDAFGRLGWTPLLLCDDTALGQQKFVLRVFSEVCWGVFELTREGDGLDHALLVYKMRNADLGQARFAFRIGEGGILGEARTPDGGRPFAKFRPTPAHAREMPPEDRPTLPPPLAPPRPAGSPAPPPGRAETVTSGGGLPIEEGRIPEAPEPLARRRPVLLDDVDFDELERILDRGEDDMTGSQFRSRVALVVESDDFMRAQLQRVLSQEMEVLEASDGVSALQAAVAVEPDVILASADMPRLNGVGFCRILREAGCNVPIVILHHPTARPGERASGLMVGGNRSLPKDVEPAALHDAVTQVVDAEKEVVWPCIDVEEAMAELRPRELNAETIESDLAALRTQAKEFQLSLCLVGYEFKFVADHDDPFVDRFQEMLSKQIRAEDALCRVGARRLLAVLVDTDEEGARAMVRRLHERMSAEAANYAGEKLVKPKALYRMLAAPVEMLADEQSLEGPLVEMLFERKSQLIDEDRADRPGEPVEKYPILEAVFTALCGSASECTSPTDDSVHAVVDEENGVRSLTIDDYRYRTQDPAEESPAGHRAQRGARIVWVERLGDPPRAAGRIEDGRVFRDEG